MYREPTLTFHIQVKSGPSYWKNGFGVNRSTFKEWLDLLETQPVVLIWVERKTGSEQRYWFLVLFDWLLKSKDRDPLVDRKLEPRFSIKRDFIPSDPDGISLHQVLKDEANRAIKDSSALWATLHDYWLLPFNLKQFLQYIELATFSDPPQKVVHELAELANGLTSDSVPRTMDSLL